MDLLLPTEGVAETQSRISMRVVVSLIILIALTVFGAPNEILYVLFGFIAVLVAWRYPYFIFYLSVATAPLLGWVLFLPVGNSPFLQHVFGDSIEVGVTEAIAGALLAAWILKYLFQWASHKRQAKIIWPLAGAYGLIVFTHILSAFSGAHPDLLLVIKYALRPVLWVYLTSVLLPVNFIRTRRQLLMTLSIVAAVGAVFALDGFRSLWFGSDDQTFLARVHPLSFFGVYPIGVNHNLLAELLAVTVPFTLALTLLVRSVQIKKWLYVLSGFMFFMALLTFARSAWIAFAGEALLLFFTIWRPWLKRKTSLLIFLLLAFLPLAGYMLIFTNQSGVQSSTDSRAMLIGIAYDLFRGNPWFGVGAGTFVNHVASTWIFTFEYGAALDSHGMMQKILAETGLFGFAAFLLFVAYLLRCLYRTYQRLVPSLEDRQLYVYLMTGVLGAFIYQLFNTTYWTPKLWLPVGILLAAGGVLLKNSARDGT